MSTTTTATAATTDTDTAATTATAAKPGKAVVRTVWTLRVLLALFFALASALPKLLALPAAATVFDAIGVGDWFMYLTGLVELAGAVGLLLPRLAGPAATALIAFLACAFVTQLTVMHGENAGTPFLFMVPLAVIAWHRRTDTTALLGRRR
ncbi:DoxX-like protein [Kitasatospora sp. SolWspMP-SS2h]|uniref:DoxX family protein n=1 Tax=Kitasatospora sp. SolWspMP-SS2h TaxID=1305729 RepID=UPI000DB92D49|nr:DoxX family protein [Kitasatospora sp. SolWspMP-SS2h]RAJ46160.1 DoxX-like protein [Kitasatospora sp. SolWspMP-SS2h]